MALTGGDVVLERAHDGRVAYLTLSHGKYTVVTMEMRRLVAERFAEIDRDPQVRVVVIRSDGQHFTSGGDIAGFMEVDPIDEVAFAGEVTAEERTAAAIKQAIDITDDDFDPLPPVQRQLREARTALSRAEARVVAATRAPGARRERDGGGERRRHRAEGGDPAGDVVGHARGDDGLHRGVREPALALRVRPRRPVEAFSQPHELASLEGFGCLRCLPPPS